MGTCFKFQSNFGGVVGVDWGWLGVVVGGWSLLLVVVAVLGWLGMVGGGKTNYLFGISVARICTKITWD